ncbi:ATP-binding cassette domain-containing protein [Opitutus terrae]|uniref:ABC transporter related n=1 Tax=Opitutus terrae (strain DSM 11246 / JCM 15787 / PB90-1) TaxID=452637 RepID=B1ZRJ4_OPITP|nr:ATP-binding cassette domain-containing protein [Opitutus terrae]ACB77644.1 ABC transporter related [Opitutus terrae PB90-1]
MSVPQHIVSTDDLRVTYLQVRRAIHALDGVTMQIPAGQAVVIVGRNGSGKSTLLGVLANRIAATGGSAFISGVSVERLPSDELAKAVFFVQQDPLAGTVGTMTVFENLLLADARSEPRRRPDREEMYRDLLRPLGLEGRLDQQAATLSPGERQALAILFAGLRPAKVVLLDEPLAALDDANVDLCRMLIADVKRMGKTLLIVTHDLPQIQSIADRVLTLNAGRIISDTLAAPSLQCLPQQNSRRLPTTSPNG